MRPFSWPQRLNFSVYWILTGGLAGAVVYPAVFWIASLSRDVFPDPTLALVYAGAPFGGAVGGLVSGLGQSLYLQKRRPGAALWLLATVVGWAAGLFVAFLAFQWMIPGGLDYLLLLVPFVLGGGVLGVSQSVLIRRWFPEETFWWVIASATGWPVGWVVALSFAALWREGGGWSPGEAVAALGAVHGAWIGFEAAIAWLALSALAVKSHRLALERAELPEGEQDV